MRLMPPYNMGPASSTIDADLYWILESLCSSQRVGRKSLATSLEMGEGCLRRPVEMLRGCGFIEIYQTGIALSPSG